MSASVTKEAALDYTLGLTATQTKVKLPIEPVTLFGKRGFPLEETERYVAFLRNAYSELQDEHVSVMASYSKMVDEVTMLRDELSEAIQQAEFSVLEADSAKQRSERLEAGAAQLRKMLDERDKQKALLQSELAKSAVSLSDATTKYELLLETREDIIKCLHDDIIHLQAAAVVEKTAREQAALLKAQAASKGYRYRSLIWAAKIARTNRNPISIKDRECR